MAGLGAEKGCTIDSCFPQNCTQRSFGHVTRMVRNGDLSSGRNLAPDLVAARTLAIKLETKRA